MLTSFLSHWSKKVFMKACEEFCIDTKDIHMSMRVQEVMEYHANNYKVLKDNSDEVAIKDGLRYLHNKVVEESKVKNVSVLTASSAT